MDPDALTDELIGLVQELRAADDPLQLIGQIIDKAQDLRCWLRLGGFPPWSND